MEKKSLPIYRCLKVHPGLLRGVFLLLLSVLASAVYSQTITGKVKDETGTGMPGVNIIVKGTATGTVTDSKGDYVFNLPESSEQRTLVFSFIGYASQEQALDGRSTIDVALVPSIQGLSEIVVTGYGTQRKSDITGAMGQVSDEALREVPVANITQALQGRVAGVDIQNTSPRPGGAPLIRIRGSRSLGAENEPLMVVDGIPFTGTINDLNPSDIISMDILKDASATAIYGSRGSNGVILISTRRGKTGKTQLTYDAYYGVNSVVGKYKLYNGSQFDAFRTEAGLYTPTTDEQTNLAAGKQTDWQDLMYKKGFITNHSIGVSGGTEETKYSVSAGYFKQTTALPGQAYTRYSLSATVDQKIGDRIKIGLNTLNSVNVNDGENVNPMFTILTLSPLYNAYNPDGTVYNLPAVGSIDATQRNPLLLSNSDSWKQQRKRLRTFNSLYGEVKIIEGLKYRINIGLDYSNDSYGQYLGSETPFLNGQASTAQIQNSNSASYTIENLVVYDKTFAVDHRLNLTGLFSVQEVETYGSTVNAQDLPADYVQYYNLGLANTLSSASGTYAKSGLLSYMARANYSFKDRYLLTLTTRTDGSSRLAEGHQWYTYPAAALAWHITKESFMSNVNVVSSLKLRLGIGQTSNQAIAPYQSQGGLGKVPYNFGSVAGTYGYFVNALPNTNLTWEFTTTQNVGLDFGMFRNRLTGSFDYYQTYTDKILQPRNLPPTSGVSSVTQNIGKSENRGFEVTLGGTILESKQPNGFTWSADVNWFMNRGKITELASGVLLDVNNGWFVGYPIDAIYDYKKVGIWQTAEATDAATFGFSAGNIKVADLNGDGVINASDRSVLGSLQPTWQGGMTNRFTYKGFNLEIILFAKVGGMLVSTFYQANQSNPYNTLEGRRNGPVVDYWTASNPTNAYPKPGQAQQPVMGSTLGYFDATFMKVRSINLGYTLPKSWLGKTGLSSVKVYVAAQNPFRAFFSPYVDAGGLDPEATGFGGSITPGWGNRVTVQPNTPPTKQFIFGVNIKY